MSNLLRSLVDQRKINTAVKRAARALRPDVIRIMYDIEPDWTGEQSLFFKVILSDAAADSQQLGKTADRIRRKVSTEIKADDLGLQTYFNFRSKSEQDELREASWER